ncbi:MAG: alpha/beta hydrolase [Clostridiales bacterium]|nr:alpha/beta hydrolase [Clostridiales bacterium]
MGESLRSQLFINSEKVGDFVEVTLPVSGDDEEGEIARIHYLEAGVGEPLLLIHSLGQSLYTWRNVFAELSDNYRVIAVDLPGHGYSSRPDTFTYTADAFAFVIDAFLEALNIKSTHVVGFSIGAMYMLRFLSLYPGRAANCVAISPGGVTEYMPALVHNMQKPFVATFARNLYTAGNVRKLLEECVTDPELIDDYVVKQYYEPISDGLAREALMYALRNYDQESIAEGLLPVEHEVLVLWGKNDRWHPPSGSVYFQSILRAGRYYLVRNAGHLLQEEAPVKLLEILYSYIPPAVPSYDVYRYTQNLADETE